jgi:hypothetical protein
MQFYLVHEIKMLKRSVTNKNLEDCACHFIIASVIDQQG